MTTITVTTGSEKDGNFKTCVFTVDLGTDEKDAATKFGDAVVYDYYISGATIAAANVARTVLKNGGSPAAASSAGAAFKPGTKRGRTQMSLMDSIKMRLAMPNGLEILNAELKSVGAHVTVGKDGTPIIELNERVKKV